MNYFHSSKRPDPGTGGATRKGFKNQPAYGVLNARLDWRNVFGQPVDVAVFANNLTDEHYLDGVFSFEDAAGFRSGFPGDPRTCGVRVGYRFGAEAE